MARTALTVQTLAQASIAPSYAAVDQPNGNYFANDGRTFLHIKNTNAAQRTVTVKTNRTLAGLTLPDQTFVVPATTGDKMAGPFDQSVFNQSGADAGRVFVDYDAGANVTIAVIQVPLP